MWVADCNDCEASREGERSEAFDWMVAHVHETGHHVSMHRKRVVTDGGHDVAVTKFTETRTDDGRIESIEVRTLSATGVVLSQFVADGGTITLDAINPKGETSLKRAHFEPAAAAVAHVRGRGYQVSVGALAGLVEDGDVVMERTTTIDGDQQVSDDGGDQTDDGLSDETERIETRHAGDGVSALSEIDGIARSIESKLRRAGYDTVDEVRDAGVEELATISQVGETRARQILDAAEQVAEDDADDHDDVALPDGVTEADVREEAADAETLGDVARELDVPKGRARAILRALDCYAEVDDSPGPMGLGGGEA